MRGPGSRSSVQGCVQRHQGSLDRREMTVCLFLRCFPAVFLLLTSASLSQEEFPCPSDSSSSRVFLTKNSRNTFIEEKDPVILTCKCRSCFRDSPAVDFYFEDAPINQSQTLSATSSYTFDNNKASLVIPDFHKSLEGDYHCAIGGNYSRTCSLKMLSLFLLHKLTNQSLQEGRALHLNIVFKATHRTNLTLVKESIPIMVWEFNASNDLENIRYTISSSVKPKDAGVYKFKETSWTFTIHVRRTPWLHPTCVVLNSSSIRVQWNHSSDHSEDRFWVIVRDPFGRETNVSASARQSSVTIHRFTSRGCGQYTVETVDTQGTRSSPPVPCEKDPQDSESGKFAEDVNGTVVYIGNNATIMSVCFPPNYVDDAENKETLCRKFGNLNNIRELPRDEPFVQLPTLEVNLANFSVSGVCILSCTQNRTVNVAKCKGNVIASTLPPTLGASVASVAVLCIIVLVCYCVKRSRKRSRVAVRQDERSEEAVRQDERSEDEASARPEEDMGRMDEASARPEENMTDMAQSQNKPMRDGVQEILDKLEDLAKQIAELDEKLSNGPPHHSRIVELQSRLKEIPGRTAEVEKKKTDLEGILQQFERTSRNDGSWVQ